MKYPFYQVDVFTSSPLGGNPLAVFPDAEGLDNETMQKIAREMNLSETTFIFPHGNLPVDFSLRIFTAEKELPFAGHHTLGTAHILRETGKVPSGDYPMKLAMEAGVITVTQGEKEKLLFMGQPLPEFQHPLDYAEEIAELLGLPESSIDSNDYPIQIVSTGLPVLFVPIISLEALGEISIDTNRVKRTLASLGTDMIYTFTLQTIHSNASVHSRAFAPALGITEDPATGSAAGALGAYLCKNNLVSEQERNNIFIEQGYEMGRPASLYVAVELEGDNIKSIRVGGESVTVIKGELEI
jgi:trans-2,3-dihydro-3-hydroxyanthranilate isomerase